MAASQINTTDSVTGAPAAIDTELVGGKHHPSHGVRDGMDEALGARADAAATTDAGTFSLIALVKRLLSVKLPSTLGAKTAANSFSVTLSTDDDALLGSVTEAAPASDTASSGLNGRLQRIAQNLTALNLPASATWRYAAAAGGEIGTADVSVKAAVVGQRNHMTWLTAVNAHATVDTEILVKDGATVLYRGFVKAAGGRLDIEFRSPLSSSVNTALNVANVTTGAQVYFNCGGYVAP
ncbi:hypothetical protein [Mesorhizobium sp.]|uniref:hypothetical protein n=1 Tax=Mesorhizobium sp. TaxID=1871066 RepID=UPI000FE99887|nr:hypothetical protein [Mesorhizobium sp.]RWE56035.1 MAG: hypothetical protein EOS24_22175 [Mesorhizobium sp.]RWF00455.1 MAG: hypothetical protein EOS68_09995 [Mesorhizobium sp.]